MKIKLILLIGLLSAALCVFASQNTVKGQHAEVGLECADCHLTDTPEKRPNWKICVDCHGDMSEYTEQLSFKDADGIPYQAVIHSPHAGQIRCTHCHSGHRESTLFCNKECHTFIIKVS